tara:strand:- start:512 stop:2065 length:1554 start_codon:yes stop_codon:yes gene_type:complete
MEIKKRLLPIFLTCSVITGIIGYKIGHISLVNNLKKVESLSKELRERVLEIREGKKDLLKSRPRSAYVKPLDLDDNPDLSLQLVKPVDHRHMVNNFDLTKESPYTGSHQRHFRTFFQEYQSELSPVVSLEQRLGYIKINSNAIDLLRDGRENTAIARDQKEIDWLLVLHQDRYRTTRYTLRDFSDALTTEKRKDLIDTSEKSLAEIYLLYSHSSFSKDIGLKEFLESSNGITHTQNFDIEIDYEKIEANINAIKAMSPEEIDKNKDKILFYIDALNDVEYTSKDIDERIKILTHCIEGSKAIGHNQSAMERIYERSFLYRNKSVNAELFESHKLIEQAIKDNNIGRSLTSELSDSVDYDEARLWRFAINLSEEGDRSRGELQTSYYACAISAFYHSDTIPQDPVYFKTVIKGFLGFSSEKRYTEDKEEIETFEEVATNLLKKAFNAYKIGYNNLEEHGVLKMLSLDVENLRKEHFPDLPQEETMKYLKELEPKPNNDERIIKSSNLPINHLELRIPA